MTRRGLAIMPALNEGATVGGVIDELARVAPGLDVLVVDDGSRDDTVPEARRRGARVISHVFNLGYGAALQTGYKFADRNGYDFVVQLDADGQHDPADVARLATALAERGADVVIGSRFAAPSDYQMSAPRTVGRGFFRRLLRACGGPLVSDPTSGFQALSRSAFRFCCADFYPWDFPDIDVLLLLHRNGFRIAEIPVRMRPSPPAHVSMHAGLRVLYYPYKMLLSTFRSLLTPRVARPALPVGATEGRHGSEPA